MPSVKRNPESLFESCLRFIAYNFTRWNRSDQTEVLRDEVEGEDQLVSKCEVNPLQILPSVLLLKITNLLVDKEFLNTKQLEWLITTETKMLCLSSMLEKSERTVAHLLQLAAASCPQLTILKTDDLLNVCPIEYYHQFLPQFKDLQVLSVSGNFGRFSDSCMLILGIHCRDLRELDVSECHVTDQGIEWLCGPTDPGHEGNMYGQCKSLEKLSISESRVKLKGIQIALRNLPHLQILEHDKLFKALIDMHKNDTVLPKYALIKLKIHNPELRSIPNGKCALSLVASLCPFITRMSIGEPRIFTDSNLLGLTALERLSELQISDMYDSDYLITFHGGLAPLLKVRGISLKGLKLDCISQAINLSILMEYCPNLESLSLCDCNYSLSSELEESGMAMRPSKLMKTEFMWEHLEKLSLEAGCDNEEVEHFRIPREVLLFILSRSPSLKLLAISFCATIDDDLLQQVFLVHQFKTLENLSFSHCHSVTKVGINLFMNETNMLRLLFLNKCRSVNANDVVVWEEQAKTSNWDFQVHDFQRQ